MAKANEQVSNVRRAKHGGLLTAAFAIISVLWISPLFLVLMNSFKKKAFIFRNPFSISANKLSEGWESFVKGIERAWAGGLNYGNAVDNTDFFNAFGTSLFITVASVLAIILCTSMCAWYITRVKTKFAKALYYLCVFSMVVPFQMVMFTLSQTADMLKLNTPFNIWIIYLGFGAGLAVFMFSGFMKSIPVEVEEASTIDGCNPLQTFFLIVLPMLKPTLVSVGILEAMWVWNDYLLPTLVLDIKEYRTIPMLIQYFRGSYGRVEMGPMMASIMLTVIPIIIVYLLGQKHIIKGVAAGAVKG